VGRQLSDAAVILGPFDRPSCAGLLLRFDNVDIAIGTHADEWVLARAGPPAHLAAYWRLETWILQS
jgi:hypothetical protein